MIVNVNDDLAKLALLTHIRRLLAHSDVDLDLFQVTSETQMLAYLAEFANNWINQNKRQADSNDDSSNLLRYHALECLWILANLSSSSENVMIEWMLDGKYRFCDFIDLILKGADLHMIEILFYLLRNVMAHSTHYNLIVQHKFKVLDCIFNLLLSNQFPAFLLENALRIMFFYT